MTYAPTVALVLTSIGVGYAFATDPNVIYLLSGAGIAIVTVLLVQARTPTQYHDNRQIHVHSALPSAPAQKVIEASERIIGDRYHSEPVRTHDQDSREEGIATVETYRIISEQARKQNWYVVPRARLTNGS